MASKKTTAEVPPPDYKNYPTLAEGGFADLVERRQDAKEAMELAEAQVKELSAEIEGYLAIEELRNVQCNRYVVIRATGRSAGKLDSKLLVERGVSADVIAECTVPGKEYTYIQVKQVEGNG